MKMLKARSQERLRRPQGAVEVANLRKRHPRRLLAVPVRAEGGQWGDQAGRGRQQDNDSTRLAAAAAAAARGIVTYNNYKPVSTHTWPFKWATHTHLHTHTDIQTASQTFQQRRHICLLTSPFRPAPFYVFDIKTKCKSTENVIRLAPSPSNPLPCHIINPFS